MMSEAKRAGKHRREGWIAGVLVGCALLVGFWEIMSNRSRRAFDPFALTAAEFADFVPQSEEWRIKSRPVSTTSIEPNIFAYEVQRAPASVPRSRDAGAVSAALREGSGRPVLVRLVHGYNMRDCMRMKGYEVVLTGDTREGGGGGELNIQHPTSNVQRPRREHRPGKYQLWRLVSEAGDVSIWTTTMLRAGDLSETGVDCRSMAFPRIGLPDDPRWLPRGITWRSLRHPVRNFRMMLRAKWNNSRRDISTFLRLKRPVWASEELLTLVALSGGGTVRPDEEQRVAGEVLAAQGFILSELQAWKQRKIAETK